MRWYVYVYYDEDHQPYYVGKGCANRAHYRRDAIPVPPRERIVFRYFDDEEHAFQLEKNLIAFWGRQELDQNGRLLNKALGGRGARGVPCPSETKKALRKAKLLFWANKTSEERSKIATAGGQALAKKTAKDYILTDPDGNEIAVKGLRTFCARHNLNHGSMHHVANGRKKSHKGWTCRYAIATNPSYFFRFLSQIAPL